MKSKALFTNNTMNTKPKPTSFLGNRAKKYPTATITGTPDPANFVSLKGKPARNTLPDELDKHTTPRPKTAPKHPKRVKTSATHSDPPKTGWIAFEDRKPPRKGLLTFGSYGPDGEWSYFDYPWSFTTHWPSLPNPPARKSK